MRGARAKLFRKVIFGDRADERHYMATDKNKTTAFLSRDDLRSKYKLVKKAWKDRKKV